MAIDNDTSAEPVAKYSPQLGNPFYRLKINWADILEVRAAAKRAPAEAMAEAKKAKVETVLRWKRRNKKWKLKSLLEQT